MLLCRYYGVKILSKNEYIKSITKKSTICSFCNHISQDKADFHVIKYYLNNAVSDRTKHDNVLYLITHFLNLYFE